jgi:hypothetical protein
MRRLALSWPRRLLARVLALFVRLGVPGAAHLYFRVALGPCDLTVAPLVWNDE